jgi:hypothetical protein
MKKFVPRSKDEEDFEPVHEEQILFLSQSHNLQNTTSEKEYMKSLIDSV